MWIKSHWFYFHYFNYLYKYTYYFLYDVCSLGIAGLQTDDFIFLCSSSFKPHLWDLKSQSIFINVFKIVQLLSPFQVFWVQYVMLY